LGSLKEGKVRQNVGDSRRRGGGKKQHVFFNDVLTTGV